MSRKMIPDVVRRQRMAFAREQATVREVAKLLREHNVGAVPIVEDGVLKGILTVNDMSYRVIAEGRDPDKTCARERITSHARRWLSSFAGRRWRTRLGPRFPP
jgi:predicted transcriptional regulator